MGDFRLSHNIVVAENMQQVPPSRNATPEEWQEIITSEIDRRFGDYEGERLYHIGINVDGYALAPSGHPDRAQPPLGAGAVGQCLGRRAWREAPRRARADRDLRGIEPRDLPPRLWPDAHPRGNRCRSWRATPRGVSNWWMLQNPDWFSIDPDAAETAAAEVEEDRRGRRERRSEVDPEAAAADPDAAPVDPETCVPTEDAPCPEPLTN